jgi:hypothetical protein
MSRAIAVAKLMHSVQHRPLTRRQFKRRIEAHLSGTFYSYIVTKLRLLNLPEDEGNGFHQRRIEDEIEYDLAGWVLHPIQGFTDRRRVVLGVLRGLRREEGQNRQAARKILKRMDRVKRIRPLPRKAAEEFFAWVECVVDHGLFEAERIRERRRQARAGGPAPARQGE